MLLASFPSPSRAVWDLGPIPIRAYALCIIAGIIAAIWISERRWVARGGKRGTVSDIAVWAVIFGLVGGRLYHVISDNELYFRAGRNPWRAFYVWEGGLGVWGAIALGGVGAWIGCRRRGIKLPPFADAAAPGIAVAQGIGRWGNYFNQELFGRPTDLPWAVRINPDRPSTVPGATGYHPTFLYESLWDLALAGVLVYVDRRFRMGRGRVFALYVMGYTAGRVWIEMLRIDTANHVLGLRLNVWTSILVFAGALVYFLLHPGPRETVVEPGAVPATDTPAGAADAPTGEQSSAEAAGSPDADAGPEGTGGVTTAEPAPGGKAEAAHPTGPVTPTEAADSTEADLTEADSTEVAHRTEVDSAEAGSSEADSTGSPRVVESSGVVESAEAGSVGSAEAGPAESVEAGSAEADSTGSPRVAESGAAVESGGAAQSGAAAESARAVGSAGRPAPNGRADAEEQGEATGAEDGMPAGRRKR